MKNYSQYVCQQCGYISSGQMGKCPECGAWGSFVETINKINEKRANFKRSKIDKEARPLSLSEIKTEREERKTTGISELDRVLGGGMVAGMVVLVAGEPGIGKSTLLLETADKANGLYITGEESSQQIKIRAERLKIKNDKLKIVSLTSVEAIISIITEEKPEMVIIDSIQTLETEEMNGASGSVGQVRECALRLSQTVKKLGIPLFLVGQVTKEGSIAGPKVLEHLVDTVLYFEGEKFQNLRILRTVKNRYGTTEEVGVFEMKDNGIKEVTDPAGLFLDNEEIKNSKPQTTGKAGRVVVCALEGNRPIMVEIQALAIPTSIPVPRRVVSGVDYNRVQLLGAIIQKYLKIPLYSADIFVSVSGGIKISEPAADLGIALAIISSFRNKALPLKTCVFGEVSLLGEIKRVNQQERRIKEAKKMGFINILTGGQGEELKKIAENCKY